MSFKIDEINGAGDGFALDFARLLVNRKFESSCKGDVSGMVIDKDSGTPIAKAKVWSNNHAAVATNAEGRFELKNLPTGFEILNASAPGYADGSGMADIGEGDENAEVLIYLQMGTNTIRFDDKELAIGESINLKNILFDQVGKPEIKATSKPELDKVVAFVEGKPCSQKCQNYRVIPLS